MYIPDVRPVYATAVGLMFIGCLQAAAARKNVSRDEMVLHLSGNDTIVTSPNTSNANSFLSGVYTEWSEWGRCSRHCQQVRVRKCKEDVSCGVSWLKEKRTCKKRGNCPQKSNRTYKLLGIRKKDKLIEEILFKLLYGAWTKWGPCSRSCKKRRFRKCRLPLMCGVSYIQEERACRRRSRSQCRKQYTFNTYVPLDPSAASTADSVRKIKNITAPYIENVRMKDKDSQMKSLTSTTNVTLTCGKRPSQGRGSYRIVGGQVAQRNSWPWQVAILEKYKEQFCGGTLIAPQWVITAAHCVRKKKRRRKIYVRVAEHDIYSEDAGEEMFRLAKDFPHPHYDFDTITNDIALLKLERPVTPSNKVGFACLPAPDDTMPDRTMCYILGWGKELNTHPYGATVLQEAQVPLVSRRRCQGVFDYVIHDTQVCAGYKKGGLDSCAGDSGGPLLCPRGEDKEKQWIIYGVTSYGEGCGEKGKFGIYTKVRKYLDWISETINSN